MNKFRFFLSSKTFLLLLAGFAMAAVLAVSPRHTNTVRSESCSDVPSVPTLNPFPVTQGPVAGIDCTDFPAIAIRNVNGGDYSSGAGAQAGEELFVRLYVHNGARQDIDPSLTTAKNVRVTTNVSGNTVSTTIRGDNTNTLSGSVSVNLPAGARLEVVEGSGTYFDHLANPLESGFTVGNNTVSLGDLPACFEFSKFIRFKVKVVMDQVQPPPVEPPEQPGQVFCVQTVNVAVVNQQITFTSGGGNGNFTWNADDGSPSTGSGNTFTTTFPSDGTKTVTVSSGGQTAVCNITINIIQQPPPVQPPPVQPPVQPPPTAQVFCVAAVNVALINQQVTFLANGGNGQFAWTADGGNPASGVGSTFVTSFAAAGSKSVVVTSGGQTAICNILINVPQQPPPVQPPPAAQVFCVQNVNVAVVNQQITFTSGGGNGNFTWNADGGSPSTGSGNTFITSFPSGGAKTVTVSSGGQTAICNVNINIIQQPPPVQPPPVQPPPVAQVFCIASVNVALVNQQIVFTAGGGNGQFTWTADGGNPASGVGSTFVTSFAAAGSKSVVVSSSGQVAICNVIINVAQQPPVQPPVIIIPTTVPPSNIINNDNDNIINNDISGDNNNNVSNNTIVTGSNNSVSNNNSCVNNSCNTFATSTTVVINEAGAIVPVSELRQLAVAKQVKKSDNGGFQEAVSVATGEHVTFKISVKNTGNRQLDNVLVVDILPGGLEFVASSLSAGSSAALGNIHLGTLQVGEIKDVTFNAKVTASASSSLQNIAKASATGAPEVQDDAWVFVKAAAQEEVKLIFNKKAFNETKHVDATTVSASRGDIIVYTLTVTNIGNAAANNFVITDDLSQVLPTVDVLDAGGGTITGNVITYPGITIPAGGSVSKSFKVQVKHTLATNLTFVMTNTFGDTVVVVITTPFIQGVFHAPKAGADSSSPFLFSGFLMAGYVLFKKRGFIKKAILNE